MFTNNPNLIKLDDGIMIYPNFLTKEEVSYITNLIEDKVNSGIEQTESLIPWYRDKQIELLELFPIWERISQFLSPTHVIHPMLKVQIIRPGDGGMFVHEDSPGEGNDHELTNVDVWTTCPLLDYGVITYFGDYEGGELFYPNLNIEISPKPGDLVIHGATSKWKHGVKEVTSGVRYAFSNFSLKAEKNPGTFYNYGTKEYYDQVDNDLYIWGRPLVDNPKTDYKSLDE